MLKLRNILSLALFFWVFLIYLALSLWFFYRPHEPGAIFMASPDPYAFIWFLNWWPFALWQGFNPFISHFVWNPIGFDMLWAASTPTLALLAWPITSLFGAITTWNALSMIAPALNSLTAFALLKYLSKSYLASFVSAFFFGFSSYVLAHLMAHLNLYFVALIPLFVLVVLLRANKEIDRSIYIFLLALLTILQFGISNEVLASAVLFAAIAFLVFYPIYRHYFDFFGVAKDTLIAAVVVAIILIPVFYYLKIGLQQLPHVINSPHTYSTDLVNFVVPTMLTQPFHNYFLPISQKFTSLLCGQGAYLGIPLLGIVLMSFIENRKTRWGFSLLIVLLLTMLFSLGPFLWFAGRDTRITLPWAGFLSVPLLRHALPERFTLYTSLIVSIFVVVWLAKSDLSKPMRILRYGFVFIALISMLPNRDMFIWRSIDTPKILQNNNLSKFYKFKPNLVVLPYGYQGASMLWQVNANMSFKMAGGYAGFTPVFFNQFSATSYFYKGNIPVDLSQFESNVQDFCQRNRVDGILLTQNAYIPLSAALESLPWYRFSFEGDVIIVPPNANNRLKEGGK